MACHTRLCAAATTAATALPSKARCPCGCNDVEELQPVHELDNERLRGLRRAKRVSGNRSAAHGANTKSWYRNEGKDTRASGVKEEAEEEAVHVGVGHEGDAVVLGPPRAAMRAHEVNNVVDAKRQQCVLVALEGKGRAPKGQQVANLVYMCVCCMFSFGRVVVINQEAELLFVVQGGRDPSVPRMQ